MSFRPYFSKSPHPLVIDIKSVPEVNFSPKIHISAQPLKKALHKKGAMQGAVIFLHEPQKRHFFLVKSGQIQIGNRDACVTCNDT